MPENELDKIKQIILEPAISQITEKINRLDEGIKQINNTGTGKLEKDIQALRSELSKIKAEIEDIEGVIVGLNNKLSKAFGSFTAGK